jgi:hypothetical protein
MSKKIVMLIVVCLLLFMALFSFQYRYQHSMSVAHSLTAGDASLSRRVLIATQGSAFKDTLVAGIVAELKPQAVYVRVIDISALPTVRENEWTAIVMLHTWEFGKPPSNAQAFVDGMRDKRKLIVVTTSGSGREKIGGVDAISSASVVRDVPALLAEITPRLDALLKNGTSPMTSAGVP